MTVSLDDEEEARQAELPDERYSPHRQAEQRELREALRAGLAAMTEEHRRVLVLRELEAERSLLSEESDHPGNNRVSRL